MSGADVVVTFTYAEEEAAEVARAILYFTSNVTATREDHDRLQLIRDSIKRALPKPKPEEPTGLGAVVEDAEGDRWVRVRAGADVAGGIEPWRLCSGAIPGVFAEYAEIDAVRVLSEGVQP